MHPTTIKVKINNFLACLLKLLSRHEEAKRLEEICFELNPNYIADFAREGLLELNNDNF